MMSFPMQTEWRRPRKKTEPCLHSSSQIRLIWKCAMVIALICPPPLCDTVDSEVWTGHALWKVDLFTTVNTATLGKKKENSLFFPIAGLSHPGLIIMKSSKYFQEIKLENKMSRNIKMVPLWLARPSMHQGRGWEGWLFLHNPCSWSHKGHGENRLRSYSPVPVMVLATTLSYSIALPKDFQ